MIHCSLPKRDFEEDHQICKRQMRELSPSVHLVYPPDLPRRDGHDADGGDGEQVEGGRSHDGSGAELARLEVVEDDLDAGEEDLRGGGAKGHLQEGGKKFK